MARRSAVECPRCESTGRIATSKRMAAGLREMYCQCLNVECGAVFVMHFAFSHYVERKVAPSEGAQTQPKKTVRAAYRIKDQKPNGGQKISQLNFHTVSNN